MAVPQISLDSLNSYGGKPKDYYLLEFFRLFEKYWDEMMASEGIEEKIDIATALLYSTCPHKQTREKLWQDYVAAKESGKKSAVTASILTTGDLFTYLSNTLEFTEEAYGGF